MDCASAAGKMAAFERLAELVNTLDENAAVARIDALSLACGFDPMSYVEREIMNETELKQLVADPLVSLGGHTLTHCNLARVPQERLEAEITAILPDGRRLCQSSCANIFLSLWLEKRGGEHESSKPPPRQALPQSRPSQAS